jgi:hypothetical protein
VESKGRFGKEPFGDYGVRKLSIETYAPKYSALAAVKEFVERLVAQGVISAS